MSSIRYRIRLLAALSYIDLFSAFIIYWIMSKDDIDESKFISGHLVYNLGLLVIVFIVHVLSYSMYLLVVMEIVQLSNIYVKLLIGVLILCNALIIVVKLLGIRKSLSGISLEQ